ncbi:MAG: right-handed parallel beta-helix repeat-containing protein [Candidatus Bathyarchaeota archaeon]
MKKSLKIILQFSILLSSFLGIFCYVNGSTEVPSVISTNTTWNKVNSPYDLRGPVLVNEGVVLTIEPGTIVNLFGYYILVNGTLEAKGTEANQISINSGSIHFSETSTDWNEDLGNGCIIENSILDSVELAIDNSPKIHMNSINSLNIRGSPEISKNRISGEINISGSPIIKDNIVTNAIPASIIITRGSPIISNNTISCRLLITNGSPIISNNILGDGVHIDAHGGEVTIIDNFVYTRGTYDTIFVQSSSAIISNNTITGNNDDGIYLSGPYSFFVSYNNISNCVTAISANNPCPLVLQWNLIQNNNDGIRIFINEEVYAPFEGIWKKPVDFPLIITNNQISDNIGTGIVFNHPIASIMNNSIYDNDVGIKIQELSDASNLSIVFNNIYANNYNIKLDSKPNISVSNNWWGTTDITEINQTIYDFKYDFNLGSINFVPILRTVNVEIPEFPSWTILLMSVLLTLAVIFSKNRLDKHNKSEKQKENH